MAVRSLSENEINELEMLRKKARDKDDVAAWQRASAMLMIARGATKASAALVHGVSVRSVFGWQEDHRSLGCEGLWDKDRPGRPPRLAKARLEQLAKVIEAGPEEGKAEEMKREPRTFEGPDHLRQLEGPFPKI